MSTLKTNSKTSKALGPVIFRGKKWDKSIEAHERTHVTQQIKYPFGLFAWMIRYKVDKKFRWSQEKEAIVVQIDTAAKENLTVNWDDLYTSLLNYRIYNGMANQQQVSQFVQEMKQRYYLATGHY